MATQARARQVAQAVEGWAAERRAAGDEEVRRARERVENLAAELRAAVRTLHDARARQRAAAELTEADVERDAERITRLPGVASVAVEAGAIVLTSEHISIERAGAVHDLGTFRIELSPDRGVRVFAAEAPPGVRVAWIHPHVQADLPCLGNARVGVEKLLGDLQLVAAAEVMLRFLGTYDPETAYCDIAAWPTRQ